MLSLIFYFKQSRLIQLWEDGSVVGDHCPSPRKFQEQSTCFNHLVQHVYVHVLLPSSTRLSSSSVIRAYGAVSRMRFYVPVDAELLQCFRSSLQYNGPWHDGHCEAFGLLRRRLCIYQSYTKFITLTVKRPLPYELVPMERKSAGDCHLSLSAPRSLST